jgi:hypothetical protein
VTTKKPQRMQQSARAKPTSPVERLMIAINHCRSAKVIADDLGESFLAYMLAMTLEDAQATLQREQQLQRRGLPNGGPTLKRA